MFKVTLDLAIFHNHRLDSKYDGRYVVRLPDNSQVFAQDYDCELAKRRRREATVVMANSEAEMASTNACSSASVALSRMICDARFASRINAGEVTSGSQT
jgi:hypothetical protein